MTPRNPFVTTMTLLTALVMVCVATAVASAQTASASIAGVVKDSSGAALPGVTIEALSPALIEKSRTVFTDGNGQYRIEALRHIQDREVWRQGAVTRDPRCPTDLEALEM